MNKAEAKRFVKRLIAGYIEELYNGMGKRGKPDPLVYDLECETECEGRRLSKADEDRVGIEMDAILERLYDDGWTSPEDIRAGKLKLAKPDGKPGSKWKQYAAWQKRQGRVT